MFKRALELVRAASADPYITGMVGLFLLGRSLAGIVKEAQEAQARLAQIQLSAGATLRHANRAADQYLKTAHVLQEEREASAATANGQPYPYDTLTGVEVREGKLDPAEVPAVAPELREDLEPKPFHVD